MFRLAQTVELDLLNRVEKLMDNAEFVTKFNSLVTWFHTQLVKAEVTDPDSGLDPRMFDAFYNVYLLARIEGAKDEEARNMGFGVFMAGFLRSEREGWSRQEDHFSQMRELIKQKDPSQLEDFDQHVTVENERHERRMKMLDMLEKTANPQAEA